VMVDGGFLEDSMSGSGLPVITTRQTEQEACAFIHSVSVSPQIHSKSTSWIDDSRCWIYNDNDLCHCRTCHLEERQKKKRIWSAVNAMK
jgi:hypothetical protein